MRLPRTERRGIASLLATGLMVGAAFAQDAALPARPGDGPNESAGEDDEFYRASEIIGTSVRDEDGQALGQVRDLLIERRNPQIR